MPKIAKALTERQVEYAKPGMHADGHGLYLAVGPSSKSWVFRYKLGKRRREMGLGSYPVVTLQAARDEAIDLHRKYIRKKLDPIDSRRAEGIGRSVSSLKPATFRQAAEAYIAANGQDWRDQRSWPQSLEAFVYPIIGNLPVASIDVPEVLNIMQPIWRTKAVTAKRLRGRIETILHYAVAAKFRKEGLNPARWRGHMELLLGPQNIEHIKHASLPWQETPSLMAALRARDSIVAKALRFTILNASRASEVTGANWREIDMNAATWTIPKERMKGKKGKAREHVVPLSSAALAVLREADNYRDAEGHIFPGERVPLMTTAAMVNLLAKVAPGYVVHGFRATFSTWAAENKQDRDLSDMCLAHEVRRQVEKAYQRSELIELRREIMDRWSRYVAG